MTPRAEAATEPDSGQLPEDATVWTSATSAGDAEPNPDAPSPVDHHQFVNLTASYDFASIPATGVGDPNQQVPPVAAPDPAPAPISLPNDQTQTESYPHPEDNSPHVSFGQTTSSAMPQFVRPEMRPQLVAPIHALDQSVFDAIDVNKDVILRSVLPEELDDVRKLHSEWFPLKYDEKFYTCIRDNTVYTLAAVWNGQILGMIAVSMWCRHHEEVLPTVLGTSCEESCCDDYGVQSPKGPDFASRGTETGIGPNDLPSGVIGYILTLGVVDEMRGRGIGKKLLQETKKRSKRFHVTGVCKRRVAALALHVIPYNTNAAMLYEKQGFQKLDTIPNFYRVYGVVYSGDVYAYYFPWYEPGIVASVRLAATKAWNYLTG